MGGNHETRTAWTRLAPLTPFAKSHIESEVHPTLYAWRARVESPTAARRRQLAVEVLRVFAESRQTSGCRRVAAALNREGIEASVGLIADLMRELGLRAVQPRAYKRTTIQDGQPAESPDLIGRDFTAQAPGQRLVGDITCGFTRSG